MTKQRGFTLIELLITLAVLGLLVAIAVPSYRAQAIRGARSEALEELLRVAQFEQQTYTRNNMYVAPMNNPYLTQNGRYMINVVIANAGQSYTITAAPQMGQADDTCGTLSITEVGRKNSTGGVPADCWSGR